MIVEYVINEFFLNVLKNIGFVVLEIIDFIVKVNFFSIFVFEQIFYCVSFLDLLDINIYSFLVIVEIFFGCQVQGFLFSFSFQGG